MEKQLVIIPVYNEAEYIAPVFEELRASYTGDVLFVDDGSSDGSKKRLGELSGRTVRLLHHEMNQGYGTSLIDGFLYAAEHGYESVVTMDCVWQHEPALVPRFFRELEDCDVVSGSRYLGLSSPSLAAPADRRAINVQITELINKITGLSLTDSFCGFKSYRVSALGKLHLTETGYALPLQFWIQAAREGVRIKEVAVPLIYLDAKRSFGGSLDCAEVRLRHYLDVIKSEQEKWNR